MTLFSYPTKFVDSIEVSLANDSAVSGCYRQYEIYSFERILLVCTEVDPFKLRTKLSFFQKDKPRDKDLINKDSKLRLKGRIFMSNVTDVIPLDRAGQSPAEMGCCSMLTSDQAITQSRYSSREILELKISSYGFLMNLS